MIRVQGGTIKTINNATDNYVFTGVRFLGGTIAVADGKFYNCTFDGAYTVTATTLAFDRASAKAFQLAGGTVNVLPTDLDPPDLRYGTGHSGALAPSSGTTSLVGGEAYSSITPTGTAKIYTDRAILRCSGLCDLRNAPAGAIGSAANANGGNASGATGGAAGTGGTSADGTLDGIAYRVDGIVGATGVAGAVVNPAGANSPRYALGGGGGGCGASGDGVSAGGPAGAATLPTFERMPVATLPLALIGYGAAATPTDNALNGSGNGRPGKSGGGSGATAKGGGGGGAAPGTSPMIAFLRGIAVGGSTPAGVIAGPENAGGNGGNGEADALATGGGSGAGGTGGAGIVIGFEWKIGTGGTITAHGGKGGAGGNGNGSGASKGGEGGIGGRGGRITLVNTITGVVTTQVGAGGGAQGPASGSTGGVGGTGGTCSLAL